MLLAAETLKRISMNALMPLISSTQHFVVYDPQKNIGISTVRGPWPMPWGQRSADRLDKPNTVRSIIDL